MSRDIGGARGRRLGAIMFTDVVGYTSMSSRDEMKTLELLKDYRALLESVFPTFEGRVVKTMGDGFLVEFASAVEAVDCAVEVQKRMSEANSKRSEDEKTMIRIGIHVGDIVHSDGDVLGDAVNVASRVEPLAEPGGICVTKHVVDQVEGKVKWKMTSMGLRVLRHLPNPVEIFSVTGPVAAGRVESRRETDRRRVAILPFANLSPDPNDKYFADGMTEELISTVSRIGELSVISRASAMRYRDTSLSMSEVGRELDVGAVLEGSVRKAGNKVRIAAQLIEVDSDRYVWSQTYDRDLTDVLGVQGEIAERVAEGLKVQLLSRERAKLESKPTDNPEAYNLYLKGRFYWNERTEAGTKKALKYFEEALAADPKFARAYTGVADCYNILADYGWIAPAKGGELSKANALKALAIDPYLAEAHASLGLTCVNHLWDFVQGLTELRKSMELNPSYVPAYHWYAISMSFMGRHEEALRFIHKAAELDPFSIVIRQSMGVSLLELGRLDEALDMFMKVEDENPDLPSVHYWMSQAYIAKGDYTTAVEEAKKEVQSDNFDPGAELDLVYALSEAGRKDEASELFGRVMAKKDSYISPCSIGICLLSLGREKEAFEWVERAYEEHD
ncbi:MAG TPA: adenylate/guanylate cyclase domain-containing protein, partial [Nitrososphaerales archaeon]|nr:adenylate/guanylate cyclase domain-containing protein [Nitrososphaerales archaeon]